MDWQDIAEKLHGIPHMTPDQGRVVYDHVLKSEPKDVLEIGTANGVGSSYIGAALETNGNGHLTTLDQEAARYEPGPETVLSMLGLDHRVTRVRTPDSTYNWWLKKEIQRHSDTAGNCEPQYDFVFLDGAHEWNIDGLAVTLIERLLRPGGWLLIDDLAWSYAASPTAGVPAGLSDEEIGEEHLRAVYELLVKPHPAYTQFHDDGSWGWAKKDPGAPRRLTLETSARSVKALQYAGVRLKTARRKIRGAAAFARSR